MRTRVLDSLSVRCGIALSGLLGEDVWGSHRIHSKEFPVLGPTIAETTSSSGEWSPVS